MPAATPLNLTIWTVPNALTISRIVMAPVTLVLLVAGGLDANATLLFVALGIMVVSEITDFLDGRIARATGQVSDTGKLLDPLSDVITHSFIFLALLAAGWMPVWMMAVILLREFSVAYARIFCALNGVVLQARWSGKIKSGVTAVAQFGTVILMAIAPAHPDLPAREIAAWALLAATAVTAYSMFDYLTAVGRLLARVGREPAAG